MPYTRYVEIGRVAMVSYGADYGKLVVISDVVDQNRVRKRVDSNPETRRGDSWGSKDIIASGPPSTVVAASSLRQPSSLACAFFDRSDACAGPRHPRPCPVPCRRTITAQQGSLDNHRHLDSKSHSVAWACSGGSNVGSSPGVQHSHASKQRLGAVSPTPSAPAFFVCLFRHWSTIPTR